MSRRSLPLSPGAVAVLGVGGAAIAGALMARGPGPGIGATIGLLYAPLVLLNLPLGIALWVPITFIQYLPFVWVGPTAASLLIFLAWLGTLRRRDERTGQPRVVSRWLALALTVFLVWITLSLAWASDVSLGWQSLWTWYVAAAVFVILVSTVREVRHVRLMLAMFVAGAALSVTIGLLFSGVTASGADAIATAAADEGRLTGGSGDPNYLAAGLVPAIIMAGALLVTTRNALARWALLIGMAISAIGLAATQSRGGLLAAAVAAASALVVFKGRRLMVAGFLGLALTLMAVWFASSPGALQRVSDLNSSGNGRSDLWHIAWAVGNDHPLLGVGLNNFVVEEQKYVRRPGPITAVALIVDKPHVAHDVYLQMYAEAGLPGVLALAAVFLALVAAAWRAGNLFEKRDDRNMTTITRALVVAQISTLVSFVFISDGPDERLWILYSLGPVLYGIARRRGSRASV